MADPEGVQGVQANPPFRQIMENFQKNQEKLIDY